MNRLEQLRTYMEEQGLDAFYVAKPANVRCISGYTGEDSYLFITKGEQFFITDPRYTEQAAYECPEYEIVNWRRAGYTMGKKLAKSRLYHRQNACGMRREAADPHDWI